MNRKRTSTVILLKRRRKTKSVWTLRWIGSDGQPRTESLGPTTEMTERKAAAIRDVKAAGLVDGTTLRDPSRISVAEFLQADRDELSTTHRPATVTSHLRDSNRLLAAVEDMPLDDFGWAEVARFKKILSARGCRPSSIASAVSSLKAAWNRALKRKLVVENPWVGMVKVKVQAKKARIFTAEEIDAMLKATDSPWWVAFIRLAYATGLRFGEMLNLTWDDVDQDTVTINAHHASSTTLEWQAKNHHQRTLPINSATHAALLRLKVRAGGSPYLFLSPARLEKLLAKQAEGKLPEPSHWLNNALRDFKVLQAHAGLVEPRGCLHDLRKTFGTRMSQHVTMPELKTLMGHASITTTADFYVAIPDDLAARVRRVQAG